MHKVYSKMTTSELLELLNSCNRTGKLFINYTLMEKEWIDELIIHLKQRDLTQLDREKFSVLMSKTLDDKTDQQSSNIDKNIIHENSKTISSNKYPALIIISGIHSVFGILVGVVTVMLTIYYFSQGEQGLFYGLASILIGSLTTISLIAVSEVIKILIDIEYHTSKKV